MMAARESSERAYPRTLAVVRRREIERRAEGHDAGRVHVALAAVIVPLDVVHVHGRGDAGFSFACLQGASFRCIVVEDVREGRL